jgi:small subunit ribosomal protein S16
MVKIRLKRLGRNKTPFYRIAAMNNLSRRDGRSLEDLGFYNPLTKELKLNMERLNHWITTGAQPTEVVKRLISLAPATGELVRLELNKTAKLSKKAQAKAKETASA